MIKKPDYFKNINREILSTVRDLPPWPESKESEDTVKIIVDTFNIDEEKVRKLAAVIYYNFYFQIYQIDSYKGYLKNIANEAFEVHQLIDEIIKNQSANFPDFSGIEITISFDKISCLAKEKVKIKHPDIIQGILHYLHTELPRVKKTTSKNKGGQLMEANRLFYSKAIAYCIDFLKAYSTQNFNDKDQLYFSALVISLTGYHETPLASGEDIIDYRNTFCDRLKHYTKI